MTVAAIGLSHRTAPLDLRARFAIPGEHLVQRLATLRDHLREADCEAVILSTCNRTELYVAAGGEAPVAPALDWLARQAEVSTAELAQHTYTREHHEAARHAFRVAAGLDSMVLGEPQILGQVKQAVRAAESAGALGQTLHQLFQRSFEVAKAVRSGTELGNGSVSYAAATVQLAQRLFGDLHERRVLCVGGGEMMASVAVHLAGRGPRALVVANRTAARGDAVAARCGPLASTMPLAQLPERLHEFDIVVSCTASAVPLIGLGAVRRALERRRREPMLLVDLALPRDIEPEVGQLADAYLHTLDDLGATVEAGNARRRAAVERADELVEDGVRRFGRWLGQRANVPLIRALHAQADAWREAELARARRLLARGTPIDEVLASVAQGLNAKMLHGPLQALAHGDAATQVAVARLFGAPDACREAPDPRA
jgi:glutamyl-tRNA reductase